MAFDKIVGVDGTTYQFPTLVRTRISDNIKQVGSLENLAVIDALGPALATKSATTHNHTLASLSSNNLDELGDVVIGADGGAGIALADKHTIQYEASTSKWRNKVASGGVTVSDSRPTSPIPGDAWFDSNDGTLYVYYTDANTTQWVQVQANSALEGTILARLGAVEARATALEATPDYTTNYLINGALEINQRNFSSTTSSLQYTFDRWMTEGASAGGTVTWSAAALSPGDIGTSLPTMGKAIQITTASLGALNYALISQKIEEVRTLAGKTVTVSWWAKAASGAPGMQVVLQNNYGTGGSADTRLNSPVITLSTSWTRYSYTFNVASAVGKTIGANSYTMAYFLVSDGVIFNTLGAQNNTFSFWGFQLEEGSVETLFHRNAQSLQGELAACQRYYWRSNKSATLSSIFGVGNSAGTTEAYVYVPFPVEMRTKPSSIDTLAASNYVIAQTGVGNQTATSITLTNQSEHGATLYMTSSGLTSNAVYALRSGVAGAYIGFNAEL